MKTHSFLLVSVLMMISVSCSFLEPKPVAILSDELVLNEPNDVPTAELGLYSAFRTIIPASVISGDCTADMILFNGTFSQYRELGTKQITSGNGSVATLWGNIYNAIYIANFILEKLPTIDGVKASQMQKTLATAHFLRGYAYFMAVYSFGDVPEVLTTLIATNRNIPRTSKSEILQLILDDYTFALDKLTTSPTDAGSASDYAVRSALARYHLYLKEWSLAEQFATDVIDSKVYTLEANFSTVVLKDFTSESIFEMGYTISDDPGTDNNIGLNNLFVGRREIIPSNQEIIALASSESGDRFSTISFNSNNLNGNDNGWSVAKYGSPDEDNNNVVVFRLPELYLIRAEARAQQGNVTGTGSATEDINVLRTRANATVVASVSQSQMLLLIEKERSYELAYEGHRWYDLVRTNRAETVMPAFSSNWKVAYELWPIPLREIQNNPALVGHQNSGY